MKRFYDSIFQEHFDEHTQMLFVMGPRQVGKTTSSIAVKDHWKGGGFYFNWDNLGHKKIILEGAESVAEVIGLNQLSLDYPIVIFDEIHKYSDWKNFLKGFYDTYSNQVKILVTGSARLNVFKKGGDSLMGRYLYYRCHPLTVAEIIDPNNIRQTEFSSTPREIPDEQFQTLFKFGGFPAPFLKNNARFANRWKRLRYEQLFQEEVRSLARVQEIGQMELLGELLRAQVGQLVFYESFAKKIHVSSPTVRNWLELFKGFYYCFEVRPYSTNITRSLIKEPKYYLWDWSIAEGKGSQIENFVASHLLKAVHFWNDHGLGDYQLNFLRDKEKREVDFVVVKNGDPWMLVEVKSSNNKELSPSLRYFQEMTRAPYAFQVVFDLPFVDRNCFEVSHRPLIVPAKTFLSQLV